MILVRNKSNDLGIDLGFPKPYRMNHCRSAMRAHVKGAHATKKRTESRGEVGVE